MAPDREITPQGFKNQLQWLSENGYHCLSSSEFLAHLTGAKPANERSVVITFDDGYADNWVYAFPSLKKFNFRAIIFVVTKFIQPEGKLRPTCEEGGKISDTQSAERASEGFLNWTEIMAMAASGLVEFGSHTHTHRQFDERRAYLNMNEELARSKKEIERRLGQWCGAIAWPWGQFSQDWVGLLLESGYRLAFTTRVGPNMPKSDPFLIRRFKVSREDTASLARRLWLYRRPFSAIYSHFYNLDRRIKAAVTGR